MVVGRGARAAHARRRPTQYGYTYCTRGTVAVTNQHAARTRPAVSGIGERRVCSTCSRLLVEPRRDPASMCTQVLATGSSALFRPFRLGGQAFATRVVAARPYAARNCEGWRVAGAGRVVKRARRAGKGGMGGAGAGRVSPQRAAARCLYESSSRAPSARDETQVRKQGEARTIPAAKTHHRDFIPFLRTRYSLFL